jgi:hypothetical protein
MTSLGGRLVLVQAVAVAVVVASAALAGTRDSVPDQVLWLNVAVSAAIVSGVANGVWLGRARRAIGRRRGALLAALDRLPAKEPTGGEPTLVALPGMTLFHRPTCPLVAGKAVTAVSGGERGHRQPCGWCDP